MSDVIRITKSQKKSIEKLIPELLKKHEYRSKENDIINIVNRDYTNAINNRDYSFILTDLIVHAANDLNVKLYDNFTHSF